MLDLIGKAWVQLSDVSNEFVSTLMVHICSESNFSDRPEG